MPGNAEVRRLRELAAGTPWRRWGPYLAERQWGTVREDYSADGNAWDYLSHDAARSFAYRWGEDGLAGISDDRQLLCFALALHNGVDPIVKERAFGLTGPQGNHGEDVKESYWFSDATPTASYLRWRYHYPQKPFPYQQLIEASATRGRDQPEFELVDTGAFAGDTYWRVEVEYAKAGPTDICITMSIHNMSGETASLTVLPTLWFRNTWAWDPDPVTPSIRSGPGRLVATHAHLGRYTLLGDGEPAPLVCDNESNAPRLWGVPGRSEFPKDGINDHVVRGAASVNPRGVGTKAALCYQLELAGGTTRRLRLRLTDQQAAPELGRGHDAITSRRRRQADDYYAGLLPDGVTAPEAEVARQACAGLVWSQQYYQFDVARWLDGDPAGAPPPNQRRTGRNSGWRHLRCAEVLLMPDTWEYPWFAAWDLAFHAVAMAYLDPADAKRQLLWLLDDQVMHPNGQLPAYEWAFDDVNPPVHAWAVLRVFEIDGARDLDFLTRALPRLLLNYGWWVNREDPQGLNVFSGGFLGLDNIGPFDRSQPLPGGGQLEQADATAWMGLFTLNLFEMAMQLARHDSAYQDLAAHLLPHFTRIVTAMGDRGLWQEDDAFFYDVICTIGERRIPVPVRSMVGVTPVLAMACLADDELDELPRLRDRLRAMMADDPALANAAVHRAGTGACQRTMFSAVPPQRLRRILAALLDEAEFLSPFGLRSLSRRHLDQPAQLFVGEQQLQVDYEPAESTTGAFGGNSNWRGPVWLPLNVLIIDALYRYDAFLGSGFTVEFPGGTGEQTTLAHVADALTQRLIDLFVPDRTGAAPAAARLGSLAGDPDWGLAPAFFEYFDGDTGAGLGAAHQTGWTALIAHLIFQRHENRRRVGGSLCQHCGTAHR